MKEPQTTMNRPPTAWEELPRDTDDLLAWRQTAFTAAKDKYHANHNNIETVLQTGEAFGRAVYRTHLQKNQDWDLTELCSEVSTLLGPLGDSFEITGGQQDMATTFLRRHPLVHNPLDWPLDSLFTYGTLRGLFLSAYPHGELVAEPNLDERHPASLVFKLHPSGLDRFTRERVKDAYSFMKRHEQP